MNPAKRILCLKLPNWPVQRAEREGGWGLGARGWGRHPKFPISRSPSQISNLKSEISSSPSPQPPVPSPALLLHSRNPRRGNCVAACSPEAEAWGVRIDMSLAEASALAHRGGRFVALAHNPAADLAELTRLAEMCERFSPCVGWETVDASTDWWPATGPAHLFLDITGIGRLFGGEEPLIAEIRRDFAREGYEIQAKVAETIGAAWGEVQSAECRVQSAKSQIPALHSALYTLHSLRLPPATLSLLAQLGITQVDELLRLPRESLRSRFGERVLLRLDQWSGAAQETIVPHHPPPRFQAEWILEYPTDSRELVEQIVSQLLLRIAQDLAERQEGVVQLTCRLDGAGGRPLQLSVGLFRPSAQKDHLEELLQMQLEQTQLPRQIGRIGLAAQLTAPLENRQTELFADSSREASRDYALLIDRLASRLGSTAVLEPVLRADPLPERAVSYSPIVGKKRRQGTGDRRRKRKSQIRNPKSEIPNPKSQIVPRLLSPDSCPLTPDPCLRPLLLHHPPQPLAAISVVPDGPPISFDFQGKTHRIDRHWGPERIETGWWRGRSHRRDYYRVETTTGHRYWLFRRLADGKWHLHGEYG
ncbi:MAG: DNA polymerase Y family protein [Planctomycetales bacterium]|nr:DNA polymerase Y family protein [Planctomycetales bacterium]